MSDLQLIEAVKARNFALISELIESGAEVNQQDGQGWTPLNWASGAGDLAVVRVLVEKGADVNLVGRDQRTPYKIALAAGHAEVVKFLRKAEEDAGGFVSKSDRKYCKAYHLNELQSFPGWVTASRNGSENAANNGDNADQIDTIVFLHEDLSVTKSMWRNENVIFDQRTPEWEQFCHDVLKFEVPDDLDFIVPAAAAAAV